MSFANHSRMSVYSTASTQAPRGVSPSAQVSATTLLNMLNSSYKHGQPYNLEASTSLVVNTWVNAKTMENGRIGGTVDLDLGRKAWEHARRRAEDGCIVLSSLHESTPSLFASSISGLPLSLPDSFYIAIETLKAFTHCVTPFNPSAPRYSALAAVFTINLAGECTGAEIKLSTSGLDVKEGLLQVPAHAGYRAFDVFYYLNSSSATKGEREFLDIKPLDTYTLLKRSGTYDPPSYLPDVDDAAAAEDFRANLKNIGIKGQKLLNLLSVLTGLLKLGNTIDYFIDEDTLDATCQECSQLLDISPDLLKQQMGSNEREIAIGGIYEAIVDYVLGQANNTIKADIRKARTGISSSDSEGSQPGMMTPVSDDDGADIVNITVVDVPNRALGKAIALRTVFDDTEGINAEMKADGVPIAPISNSVIEGMKEAQQPCEAELGINGSALRETEQELEKREAVLDKIALDISEESNFVRQLLYPVQQSGIVLGKHGRFDLPMTVASSRVWFQLALHPTDAIPTSIAQDQNSTWQAGVVSRQLREWRLPEWANRRNRRLDFTADFDHHEFYQRYHPLGCMDGKDGITNWTLQRGWSNGEVVVGTERVWVREGTYCEVEAQLDHKTEDQGMHSGMLGSMVGAGGLESGYPTNQAPSMAGSGFFPPQDNQAVQNPFQSNPSLAMRSAADAKSIAPTTATAPMAAVGDYGLGAKGDENKGVTYYDAETAGNTMVTEMPITATRRMWVAFVWAVTFWIPSPALQYIGRMKRPDVRMAWREKFVLVLLICLFNGFIVFYIIGFGKLLCPNKDKVWARKEVAGHQGESDFFVSHHGVVYDLSSFWKKQHSDSNTEASRSNMIEFAGADMDPYIMPPLYLACPNLINDSIRNKTLFLTSNNTEINTLGVHKSGSMTNLADSNALKKEDWYPNVFLPAIREFRKGDLVWEASKIKDEGEDLNHMWFTMGRDVYDLTDYFKTLKQNNNGEEYQFLDNKLVDLVKNNAGHDIKKDFEEQLSADAQAANLQCLQNTFYVGKTDFRMDPKCRVNDYILLGVTIILCSVIVIKFLAALQLGSRKRPANQDKFVICHVPAYTEGEDQIRKGLDSLTALAYDNKRKLICVVCDGMIVGGGNDRPTPKIVLDILGVDPKVDPPALPFWSVGEGSLQLNYGKVYSGLYEFEGNVVPYIVVVKMGKESEQSKSKPGNRGKRDSQILLMSFLNRVHHRAAMNPLELEMFHQINNIIGVDPELYEYLLMVDADTMVKPDALNRLVASCANDSKIVGICGETSLENEEQSWWTMIQVYEYYISHHLTKAFESLFGSVTCLPGCFCMYRLRTADKGKPLIIADKIIKDYSDCVVDTLHKKNLLSLGEDRYLTTLMTKHFPSMSYKFIPDAYALTAAPETWSILLSQRRRWINSTIHNLAELVYLKDLCGFCCFSMRFVVFIDLFGTLALPSICAYLVYLIYMVASKTGQFPMITIIMLAAVYGLQAAIFIIKRQWQHIGWMIIYLMAFPIFSLVLPMYSFWKQDDFSWGNTRVVIGETGLKKAVMTDDEGFDPKSIPMMRWDEYAERNDLPGRRGVPGQTEKGGFNAYEDETYEMNDMQSVYSSVKPASTIMSNMHHISHMPPQSPGPYQGLQPRQSTYSQLSRYQDNPHDNNRLMSMGGMSDQYGASPYGSRNNTGGFQSSDNLMASTPPIRGRSPLGYAQSRPGSTVNFQNMMNGPSDATIIEVVRSCLNEGDLDRMTKKQLVALAEQRLQTQLTGERRIFLNQTIDNELALMG